MKTKFFARRFAVLTILILLMIVSARADTQDIGALPHRGQLKLVDGELRAFDANGALRWKLSRRTAGLMESSDDTDFNLFMGEVELSRDGKLLALCNSHRAQVRETRWGKLKFVAPLWNPYAKLSLPLRKQSHAPQISFVSWNRNFQSVLLPGPQQVVRAMSFSPDGKHLAIGGWQTIEYSNEDGSSRSYTTQGRVRVFETSKGRIARTFEIANARVYGLQWKSRTRIVAHCGDGRSRTFAISAR